MTKDLSIGFLWREDEVAGRFCVSLARLLLVQNPVNHVLDVMSGPDLAKGRNRLVETFLKDTDDERLLMLDSDMVFDPKTVLMLVQASLTNEGVIGGHCVKSDRQPTIFMWEEGFFPLGSEFVPRHTLLAVGGTGAACLVIPRSVLEDMEYGQWFTPIGEDSEDLSFCRRLMEMETPLLIHTGARFGHAKSEVLWPE